MIRTITNITKQTQQIMFIDGTGQAVYPKKSVYIDLENVSKDELERVNKFFEIDMEVKNNE